jgi:hypothetical protein
LGKIFSYFFLPPSLEPGEKKKRDNKEDWRCFPPDPVLGN